MTTMQMAMILSLSFCRLTSFTLVLIIYLSALGVSSAFRQKTEKNFFHSNNMGILMNNKSGMSLNLRDTEPMLEVMEKVRVVLKVDEEIRDALRLESALAGKDMADIIADIVKINFADALAQIRARRVKAEKKKKE